MRIFYLILGISILISCKTETKSTNTCVLKGEIIDRESDTLILKTATEDARFQGSEIPIVDNKFSYTLEFEILEEYQLIFKDELERGVWRPISFFPDGDELTFSLFPLNRYDENTIDGSHLTAAKISFEESMLDKYGGSLDYWYSKLNRNTSNYDSTNRPILNKIDSINLEVLSDQLSYIQDTQSIYAYSLLTDILINLKDHPNLYVFMSRIEEVYGEIKSKYPDHPYTKRVANQLNAYSNVNSGGNYADFSALDKEGTKFTLSEQIKRNRLTLLDLWAPWCGPCIKKSRAVLVNYQEFNQQGLEVIAVVGGIANEQDFQKAITRHSYPWIVLKEINKQNRIWEKYNIGNGGGSQFLIDQSGKIVKVNPSIEEIRSVLASI